ncbi:PTPRM [Bugula neritina]|uniref:protein-tyrosine-phosphatase n=1 Tax=Bugula neritina TaxID=10212 RepID=A0A7J7KDJ8_BUGNE|nr:PTPRM [Bugula neritina]
MIQSRYTPSRSDTRKIKIQFNLPDQDVKINCESVKLKEFKLDGSTVYLNHNSYINDLLPYKNYTIQVKVTNNKDLTTADMLVIETWELEPYDSPVILRNESYNESCIFIQWRSPSQPNGVIKRYQHRHYIRDNSVPQWLIYTDVQTENSYLACGYKAGDLVTYEIRAGTKVGYGPEATGDVRVTCGSCASISHYDLTIRLNEQQFFYKRYSAEETREKVLEDLDPYTNYTIILLAVNNAFNQSSAEPRYISTPELAPYDEPSLSLDFDTSCAHLTIQDPTQPNGIITEYQYTCYYANTEEGSYQNILATDRQPVSLCKFRSAEKVKCSAKAINSVGESPVTSQTGYTRIAMNQNDKAELRKTKNVGKSFVIRVNQVTLNNKKPNSYVFVVQKETSTSKRKKRSSVQLPPECDLDPDCYITAEIDSSLVDSGGYDFRVGDGKTYQDYYNAPLEPNQGYKIYQAVTVQNEDGTILVEYFKDPISVILKPACDHNCTIAVSVTISIAVLTVVVVGIIFVMRKPGRSSSKPTIAESLRRSLQRNDVYEQFESTSLGIGNLEDYVEQKQHIKDQYKAFNSIPKPVMSAALLAENKGKCRYKGLYPADETRVVLQRESSTESDFINASYIYGFSPEARKTFIAAQGPMKATVDDFWLMIWQQRPKAVVMVTNVIEDGKQKCEQYWPDDTSTELRYGDITVSMVSAEEWAEYVVRVLNVEKSGEKRRVRQYHYTAWPDHGVPDTMSPFISFYKKIKTETYRIDGALLVHCSAGVGRTGTFIAMNNLLEQAEIHQQVDFSECVRKMRANRPSMVQTVEQYVFLHGVVNELLATSKYPCAPSDIQTKLAKHREANSTYSNMATAEIDEEFLRIGRYVSDHGLDVEEGRKPENSNKNRNMSVLPPSSPSATDKKEKYLRPVISSGNGYINAVMVNAYRKQNQFIATQLPLVNTMTDFWQMIEEYRVSVIVQLDPCNSRNVYVLQKTNWSRADENSNAETLSFLEMLEKHQQKTGNHNICVTSL